jgi:hypothetical protein
MKGATAARRARLAPYAWLLFLAGLVYLPLFLGQVLYQRDISRWVYPARAFLHGAWARGDSALWNPLQGLGQSTLANPLSQLFYPPGAPSLFAYSPRWVSIFLCIHLVLGGFGMVALARALARIPVAAALVAGLAWCLSGYTTSEVTAGLRLESGAYIPWCALGLLHLSRVIRDGGRARAWLAASAKAAIPFALCFMTGEVFFPFLAALFALGVVVGDHVQGDGETVASLGTRVWVFRLAAGVCLAALLTGLLAAAVLVPARAAVEGTARTKPLAREVAEVGSFHPWRLAEMIAPGAMGDPYADYPAGPWVGEPGLGERPLLYGCYLGSSVAALALLAFGRKRKLAVVLGITALVALLASFGRHTGAHAFIRALIPPLSFMRGPEKYLSIFFACTSLLAGLGSARLFQQRGRGWMRMLVVGLVLLGLLGASGLFPSPMVGQVRTSVLRGLLFALAVVAVGWLTARSFRFAGPLVVLVVLLDLARAVFALQNFAAPNEVGAAVPAVASILADARAESAPPRVHRVEPVDLAIAAASPPTTVLEVQRNLVRTLIDNYPSVFGIASVPGYDAALPSTLASLWLRGQREGAALFRLLGVNYAVLPSTSKDLPGLVPMLDLMPGARLYRVSDSLPRVYWTEAATVAPDSVAQDALFAPEVLAGRRIILAPTPAVPADVALARPGQENSGVCRLTAFANTRVEASCEGKTPGFVVFLEQFDPGWSATLDGQSAPLLRANLVMRAVPVPAGTHHLVLVFAPHGLKVGILLSLAGLVALGALLALGMRRQARA